MDRLPPDPDFRPEPPLSHDMPCSPKQVGRHTSRLLDRLGGRPVSSHHPPRNGTPALTRVTKEVVVPLSYATYYRGHLACPCQVEWLPVFEAEAQRRGILTGPLPLSQIIGGAPESGGTHSTGGADDTYPLDGIDIDAYVWLSRQMGADATWHRPYNWDGRGGVAHVHRVLTGCPHNGPARYQIDAVRAGYNGLGHLGHGAPDDGPRPLSGRTWQQGIEWAKAQEDDMPYTETELRKIIADEIHKQVPDIAKAAAEAFLSADVISRLDVSVREALRVDARKAAKGKGD